MDLLFIIMVYWNIVITVNFVNLLFRNKGKNCVRIVVYFTKASSKLGQFAFCLGDILHDQTRVSHREKEGLVAQYFYWIVIWWERFLIFRHFIVCNLYQAGAWYTVAAWLCMGG